MRQWGQRPASILYHLSGAMLCTRCRRSLIRPLRHDMLPTWRLPERAAESPRLLLCSGCGALLPAADSTEVMLGKLVQLARFGLDAEGRALLGPAAKDS